MEDIDSRWNTTEEMDEESSWTPRGTVEWEGEDQGGLGPDALRSDAP